MKAKHIKLINLIVAVLVALFCIGQAFAWFATGRISRDSGFNGSSAGAYFAYGTGTKEDPFGINKKYHLYNLAWLQNTGRLVDANGTPKQYYFELDPEMTDKEMAEELDMSDFWLPPIGNDKNPFIGVFNGNGKTIKNLRITTNKKLLTANPADEKYEFSNAVGFFGMTGSESEIRNFILDDPYVQVANDAESAKNDKNETLYSSESNNRDKKVAGLAIGYVAGKASSIGVYAHGENVEDYEATTLDIHKAGYSTFNSIIGNLADNVSSSVTGGGSGSTGSGGSGSSFGATFDVESMYDRLEKIYANNNSDDASWRLPVIDAGNDNLTLESLEKLPFTITAESTYVGSDAYEVISDNNIGYLLGNQNKVYNKTVKFGDPLIEPDESNANWHYADGSTPATKVSGSSNKVIPRWLYRITAENVGSDTYNDYTGFSPLSSSEFNALPEDVRNVIPVASGEITGFNSVRLSQTYQNVGVQIYPGTSSNGQWSPHGQISWMGKTYGEGYTMTDYQGPAVDENGIRYTADGYKIEDGTDYMYDENGYFVSNGVWPFQYSGVDEEGYIVDYYGERYFDIYGDEIKYGGYSIDSEGYLVKSDGNRLLGDNGYNQAVTLQPKTGTTVEYFRYLNGIALPNCGIWFKPSQVGKIRLVMYTESAGDGFTLIKGTRTNATPDNPFYVDYGKAGSDIETEEVAKFTMPSWCLFYFEFDVEAADILAGNVEYWLMQYGGGGAYFVYMDLGASAADDYKDNFMYNPDVNVSAIDFIYSGVGIEQDTENDLFGNFIIGGTLYTATGTTVYFEELKVALKIVYVRLTGTYTMKVNCGGSEEVTDTRGKTDFN